MARNDRLEGIQVFRGSRGRQDVFTQNSFDGCCGPAVQDNYDKLADRTRFDNSLAHSNPTGANDKFNVPSGNGFSGVRSQIIRAINEGGVGTHISILAVPTYAFVTGISVHIEAEEAGLTFDLVTRNGLVLPSVVVNKVTAAVDPDDSCSIERVLEVVDVTAFEGFGVLGGAAMIDIFGRDGQGQFSLEADEIALRVATMPTGGIVQGTFDIRVAISYDIIDRAEF